MAKNFFYRINPTEVMAAAGFEVDREKWFIQFFRDLMADDPDKAETDLAAEYIREAHAFRDSRSAAGKASASKRQQKYLDVEQESTRVEHTLNYVQPVAVTVTEDQNLLPDAVAPAPSSKKKKPAAAAADPRHSWFVRWWCWACERVTGDTYAFTAQDAGIIKKLLTSPGFDQLLERSCFYLLLADEKRFPRGSPTLKGLAAMINQIAGSFSVDIEIASRRTGLLPQEGISLKFYQPWAEKEAA